MFIYRYLRQLSTGRMVLWCYLIWYLVTCWFHFDPSPRLWLSSLGLSAIIGCGLMLSVSTPTSRWQTFRLFLMPFCVSSFAALIKDRGFILIVSPVWQEAAVTFAACLAFCALVAAVRHGPRMAQTLRRIAT